MLSGGYSHSKPEGCYGFAWRTCPLGLVQCPNDQSYAPCRLVVILMPMGSLTRFPTSQTYPILRIGVQAQGFRVTIAGWISQSVPT